ncbi:MAG: radical SAM protein [Proteobacteria bacterium]|nr:radical SAM protein [Pseudomonadota bacterium]
MHFTEPVYRNPYWPTHPLLQVTQGCTHNKCKFCTMYKDNRFCMQPMEWIEDDLKELSRTTPDARTIQLLSANPLVMTYDRMAPILEMIHRYLHKIETIYTQGRVSDLKNKTADELRKLKELGMREISLGVESGDDWTLERIHKGVANSEAATRAYRPKVDSPMRGAYRAVDTCRETSLCR